MDSSEPLDERSVALLSCLDGDPRMSIAELSRRVGISPTAVTERLRRLHREGVIAGTALVLDPRALGYQLTAFVRIRPRNGASAALLRVLDEMPEVAECHHTTGVDCYLVRMHARDMGHLETLTNRITDFGETTTSLSYSAPIPPRSLVAGLRVGVDEA